LIVATFPEDNKINTMVASYRLALTVLGVAATFADAGKDDAKVGDRVDIGCSLCDFILLGNYSLRVKQLIWIVAIWIEEFCSYLFSIGVCSFSRVGGLHLLYKTEQEVSSDPPKLMVR